MSHASCPYRASNASSCSTWSSSQSSDMLQAGLRGKRLLQWQDGGVMSRGAVTGTLACPRSLSIRLEGLVLGQASFLGSVTVVSFPGSNVAGGATTHLPVRKSNAQEPALTRLRSWTRCHTALSGCAQLPLGKFQG